MTNIKSQGRTFKWLMVIAVSLLLFEACKKDPPDPPVDAKNKIVLNFDFSFENATLVFDSLIYTNSAGNKLSFSRLQFLLSDFSAVNEFGNTVQIPADFFVDARLAENSTLEMEDIPVGNYQSFSFVLGLTEADNFSGSLPNTNDMNNMSWPEPMGGGYHFLKLEGKYLDSTATTFGYAFHMGTDGFHIPMQFTRSFSMTETGTRTFQFEMDLSEWFTNPYTYDFNADVPYTMGDSAAMRLLKDNGAAAIELMEVN